MTNCKDCKHWLKTDSATEHGECRAITDDTLWDKPPVPASVCVGGQASGTLYTLPTFGCVLGERVDPDCKPPKET